jgi:hypothetical protein
MRLYHIWAGDGYKKFLQVRVSDKAIELHGERIAVANAAWRSLMGQGPLGEDIDKRLPTRRFLRTEMLSRGIGSTGQHEAFNIFVEKIKFQLVVH